MGTTVGNKDIATTGSGHQTVTPPATSLNPPTPPAGPIPVPYPYQARSATASGTKSCLKAGDEPVLVKGSEMSCDPPCNQPSQPTGGDVVSHGVKAKAYTTEGSSNTKAGGDKVCATGDMTKCNVMSSGQAAQQTMPLLKAGGGDGSGDKDGEDAEKDKKGNRAINAQRAKRDGKKSGPDEEAEACGDPVAVVTGSVIDHGLEVSLPGAIPVEIWRHYSSARNRHSGSLGRGGWILDVEQWLREEDEVVVLRDADGRETYFARVAVGETSHHRLSRLALTRRGKRDYQVREHDTGLTRHFQGNGPGDGDKPGARAWAPLRRITDPSGNAVVFHYEDGELALIADTAGREVRLRRDREGRVARIEVWAREALQVWTDYAYSEAGELASVTDALGYSESYRYDGYHRLVEKTRRNGVRFYYVYDEDSGRCIKSWGDGGILAVELAFDLEKGQTTISGTHEPRIVKWNADGAVLESSAANGDDIVGREYDDDGLMTAETNAAGETFTYEYDERGRITRVTDPAGNSREWEYAGDVLVRDASSSGHATTYRHDAYERVVDVRYATGASYTLGYDGRGNLAEVAGDEGWLVRFAHDAEHNLVEDADCRGRRDRIAYDALGRPVTRLDHDGATTSTEYDPLGRPTRVVHADGSVERAQYDAMGYTTWHENPDGQVSQLRYGGTGVLTELVLRNGQSWRFFYDADERLRRIENPQAEQFRFDYGRSGKVETETSFDGRVRHFVYDKVGRLRRVSRGDAMWREYDYDALGNIVEDRAPDGRISFERDSFGRVLMATLEESNGTRVTRIERDALGRVVAESQNDVTVRYELDRIGRLAAREVPGGGRTEYAFDALGGVAAIVHEGRAIRFSRDEHGHEIERRFETAEVRVASKRDRLGRLVEQRTVGGKVVTERRWQLTRGGRVARLDDSRRGTTLFQHDAIGQLMRAQRAGYAESFGYDAVGSLVRRLDELTGGRDLAIRVSAGNVVRQVGDTSFEQDEYGRCIAKVEQVAGERRRTAYGWDSRDRLREVYLPDGRRVHMTYDAFGRRIRKETIPAEAADVVRNIALAAEGKPLPRPEVVDFVWDGNALAADIGASAAAGVRAMRTYLHLPNTLAPVAQWQEGELFAYVNDARGMPLELIDERGRVAWAASRSAWGEVLTRERDPASRRVDCPFALLGQYRDDDIGLACTRFRYFDQEHARWLSADPLGIRGGPNLFAFPGSPVHDVDPFGLSKGGDCDGPRYIYRRLNDKDVEAMRDWISMRSIRLQPRGEGGTILDQVQNRHTKYMSAAFELEGLNNVNDTGTPVVRINVDRMMASGSGLVDHENVLTSVRNEGGRPLDLENAINSREVMITNGLDPSAFEVSRNPRGGVWEAPDAFNWWE